MVSSFSEGTCAWLQFAGEFSAVTAPLPSSSWSLNVTASDRGLYVELVRSPCMVLIADRVLRYISWVVSSNDDASGGILVRFWSLWADVDSVTSSSNGKRSSRLASHSRTNLVRGSVVKKGWCAASCVKGSRNNPPVLLSYFFSILTSPVNSKKSKQILMRDALFNGLGLRDSLSGDWLKNQRTHLRVFYRPGPHFERLFSTFFEGLCKGRAQIELYYN